jgi:hypothetical protein
MDESKLEPLEPLDIQEPKEGQAVSSGIQRWNLKRLILPAGIVLGILLIAVIYLLISPVSEKLVAQIFRFDIPKPSMIVISISNKQERQAIIAEMYPVFFGKENSGIYTKSIEGSTIEGISLPLVLNPEEVRVLKIHFKVTKKELDQYADQLKDSSHIVISKNGPLPGQLEGNLGLSWKVADADGKKYTNTARLAYYILTPNPPGFADSTSLTRSWVLSDEPFELCTQEDIANKNTSQQTE